MLTLTDHLCDSSSRVCPHCTCSVCMASWLSFSVFCRPRLQEQLRSTAEILRVTDLSTCSCPPRAPLEHQPVLGFCWRMELKLMCKSQLFHYYYYLDFHHFNFFFYIDFFSVLTKPWSSQPLSERFNVVNMITSVWSAGP